MDMQVSCMFGLVDLRGFVGEAGWVGIQILS